MISYLLKVKLIQEENLGYLPEVFKDFIKQYPEVNKSYDSLANVCHKAGPLDKRMRRLVELGISIGMSSEGGVRSHARRALEEGVAPEEVRHCVLLAFTTCGFPTMIAAYRWVEEVIDQYNKPVQRPIIEDK
jgi:4-carboxymuconolactone decarboxylase